MVPSFSSKGARRKRGARKGSSAQMFALAVGYCWNARGETVLMKQKLCAHSHWCEIYASYLPKRRCRLKINVAFTANVLRRVAVRKRQRKGLGTVLLFLTPVSSDETL